MANYSCDTLAVGRLFLFRNIQSGQIYFIAVFTIILFQYFELVFFFFFLVYVC